MHISTPRFKDAHSGAKIKRKNINKYKQNIKKKHNINRKNIEGVHIILIACVVSTDFAKQFALVHNFARQLPPSFQFF